MNKADISRIEKYVKKKMSGESSGHDWFHVQRVFNMATLIATKEKKGDLLLIQATSLLHDLGDWKLNTTGNSEEEIISDACQKLKISADDTHRIKEIILNMSYSKNIEKKRALPIEGKIVQDADRIDALGAIGIARVFAYGGKKGRLIYDPSVKPQVFSSIHQYKKNEGTTINHFYEKLLLLRKTLNTKTAKAIASKRERFMKEYLKEFYAEWRGKR